MGKTENISDISQNKEISGNADFEPEWPYCKLINGRRPPDGMLHHVTPQRAKQFLLAFHLKNDRSFWTLAAEELDNSARTGEIKRRLAAQLAASIRRGQAGILPISWLRSELPEQITGGAAAYLGGQRKNAAMYRLAAERGQIEDPHPRQTIIERCGISERTWERWSSIFNRNSDYIASELEMLLLEAPFLLENLEDMRCALLIKRDPDTEEEDMTDPDR